MNLLVGAAVKAHPVSKRRGYGLQLLKEECQGFSVGMFIGKHRVSQYCSLQKILNSRVTPFMLNKKKHRKVFVSVEKVNKIYKHR